MQTERDFRAELDALDETPGTPDEIERPSRSAWSPSTPLAKEVVDSEIVDQIGIRKTIEDEEKRETARRESSPLWTEAKNLLVAGPGAYLLGKTLGRGEGGEGALGTIGKLSDDERLQWIADEKVSADRSLAFWDNVKKTYGDKIKGAVAPVLDYSAVARAALKQAGVLGDDETIGGQFGSWLDRKTNENIALAKRRRLLAEQMEAGTREAPKFGALRSSFDDIERGIANVVASGIKGVAYGIETGDLIRVNPAIDAHLVDVLKRTGVISGNPSEAQKRNIYRFGAWIENETKAQFPEDDARANEFRKALSEGVGSMIGFMGAGFTALAIGKGAGISTLASGLMGGLSQAGSMTDDALKKYLKDAGTEGRKLTPEEERKATQVWLMGLGIGATEAVPLANFFAGHSGRFVRGVLLQATEEGGQEWVQQVLENVVAQRYYDPERKWDDNAWDGLAIGGIIGAKMQAGQAGIDRLRGQKPEEPVKAPAKVDEPAAPPMSLPDVPVPDVLPMIDGEGDGKAPRVRTTRPVDPDLEKYRQQIQAVRPPVSTPETVPGEKPAETKIPTFNEILSVLPRDERGDPDMGALVDQLEQFGVRAWNGLNDDQRRQVYETLKPVVGVVQANPEAVVKTVDEAIGEVVKAVGQEDMRQAVVPADAPVFEKASFTDAERRAIVTSDPKADVQKLAVRQGVKVVGHVSVERSSDGRRLMIHPELDPIYQRQGIGSKVYDSFAKVAASEGRRLVPSDMLSEAALGAWRKRDSDAVKDYKPNKELSSLMGRTTLTKGGVVSKNLERGILEGIGRAFEAADIPPTDSQRQAFNTVLRSKAKRSEWAKAAGVSKTQLDVLVNEALADGRLKKTKAGGIARTGKKVEVKATPATGQASGQPQAETRVEPTLSTGQGTGQAPTMDRATERRLEAVKSDVARGYAQQLIDAGTDATKFSSIVSKLSKDKKAPVAVVHEVATVITGQKGKTKQDSLNRLALAMPSKVSAPAETAETPAAPEPAAPSPVAPAQAAIEAFLEKKVRIEDAGEKIGGARKDAWASRGLNLEDLVTMSNGEQAKYVTKDGVWPKPDYAAMVADGMPAEVAALVKLIRDGLAAKPKVDTPDGRRAYVTMMGHVRSEFEKVRSIEDISKARDRIVYDLVGWPRGTFERGTPEQSTTLFSVFKGRREALRPDGQMQRKARQMVADGFPGDVEPWTRRFTVRRWSRPDKPENYAVLNKQGRLQAEAPTEAEAKAKAKEIYEAELAKGGDEGILPERPHLDNVVRTGKDIRGGRDVDSSDFLKDFGFRGIEFGNWVAGDERQKVVNLAYDALHDMANVLGIPPRAVSLNGTLGLAFGARGSGKFLAHYEPAKLVINMTKLRGAGSLAHEWAHALDHYFGELGRTDAYQGEARGASGWYERAKSYSGQPLTRFDRTRGRFEEMRLANIRPEMSAAFDGVMDALFNRDRTQADVVRDRELALERAQGNAAIYEKRIKTFEASDAKSQERNAQYGTALRENLKATQERIEILRKALDQARGPEFQPSGKVDSSFFTNAKKLSGKQAEKGYWARPTEMFARSFESYVFDKIAESGGQSDYLAQGVEGDRYSGPEYKGNPYPDAIERDAIKAAFDRLFDTMESTPEGALYAIATPPRVVSENLARRAVLATLRSGKAFALNDSAKQAMRDAMAKMPDILPPGTRSGFATKVAPNPAGSAQPFRAWFELNDGSTVSLDGSLDNFVGNGAGFLPTRKGGLVIHFVYAPVTADSIPTLAGRRWHEAIHALYAAKMFDPATWSLLVGHAETLGVLDISVRSYLTSIGEEPNGATNASLRDTYTKVYSGRMSGAQLQDVLDQEAVAIMTELLVMGVDLPLPDNIRSILSDIETGVIQRQGDEVDSAEGPVLAALRAPDRAKEVVDRAARMLHYRVGLSLRGLIDPQMKTARRIAKEPFDLTQVVVKSRTTEEVPLRDVFTIQQMVSIAGVKDKIDRPTSDDGLPPSLFKFNGLYYVNDGNHRVVAARALGQRTIRAEVIELARKEDVAQDAGAEVSRSADAASKPLGSKANAEGAPLKTSEKRSLGSFLFALGAPPTDHFSPESQDRKTLAKHFGATRIEDIGPDDPHPGRVLAFHGTYSDVDRFDVTRVRDLGVHFGTAEQSGSRPTSGTEDGAIDDFARTIPAVLDLNKAVTLTDLGTWSPELLAQDLEAEVPELRGLSERLRAAIPRSDATTQARARRMNIIRDALTSAGIDGIRYRNNTEGEGWSYIVWEPGHVISATSGNMLFALGGVRAETADLDALSRAETMETAGEPREAIWDKTGWFRGVDGKWRFEIDDSQATVTRTPKMRFGWAQLSDGVDHPSLYEAYPGLAKTNAQIIVDDTMSDDQTIGYAGEIDKWYWLKPRNALSIAANKSDVKPSTLHEIQHLIQRAEGFARGGDPRAEAPTYDGELVADFIRLRNDLLVKVLGLNAEDVSSIPANVQMSQKLWLDGHDRKVIDVLVDIEDHIEGAARGTTYLRLAGEVEARAVAKRAAMTLEERRARPPWLDYEVSEDRQIINLKRGGISRISVDSASGQMLFALGSGISDTQIDAETGQSMRRDLDSLGFYSKALEAARGLKQEKGTPEQMLAQLKKAGVKDAEIQATGLDRLFKDGSTTALESDAITLSPKRLEWEDFTAVAKSITTAPRDVGPYDLVAWHSGGYVNYDLVKKGATSAYDANGNSISKGSFRVKAGQNGGVEVTNARIADEAMQKKGIGTRVYNIIQTDFGDIPLMPSPWNQLSPNAVAFWAKRDRKKLEWTRQQQVESYEGDRYPDRIIPQQQGDRTASPTRRALLKQITREDIIKHLEENRVELREARYATTPEMPALTTEGSSYYRNMNRRREAAQAAGLAAKDPSGPYAKYIPAVEAYHAKAQLIGHNQGPPTTEWDSPFIYSLADDGAAPSLNQVIQSLKDTVGVVPTQTMLGVTIKAGDQEFRLNPRGNVAGQTQMATGAVGVRKSRHLEAIAHETAHYLETTLGAEVLDLQRDHQADLMAFYDARPDQPYSAPEAFAEFFRTYITNPSGAQAAAPDLVNAFEDVLEANGMLDGIHETQTLYQDWLARATPEELASDVVSIHAGNSWTELKADRAFENVPGKMATAYTNTIDDLNPLNKIVRKLLETADRNGVVDEEGRPISIKVAENPYKIARMFRGSYGTGYSWLTKGIAKRGETSVAFAPLSRALETLFGSANKKDWDQAMYQTAGQYLISKRALAEYDRLESKEARLGEINDLLGEGQEAWRQLSLENQQAGTTLERRESALIRQQALMRDRRNALRVSETALARLQERIQDKKDDVTAAQMARDEALTARRRRDLSILERDSQIALRQTQGLIEQYEGLSTDVAMLSAEIDQLRQRRDGLDGQLSGVSEAIEGLRREREATQKRGASRAPTKEPKEWHQDFIAKTEADPKYARIKDFASLVYEFSQGMLTLKHQHGLISDDLYAELSKRKDWYVPFQRDMSDANPEDVFFRGAGIEKWSPVKKFDGSDRAIINPLETMAGDAYTLAQQIAFNSATDALAKLAERAGPGSASIAQVLTREESAEANAATFDRIKNIAMSMGIDEADALRIVTQLEQNFAGSELSLLWSPATKGPVNLPTVPLYRNGERILVRFTDPEFGMQAYNAFSGMGKETAGLISEILGYPARLLQQGVTTHPTFIPRNLFRDIFDAWIKTGALPIVTQVKGVQAMRNDQFMRGYLEAGGITGGRNLAALTSKEKQVEILDLADKSISKGDVTLGSIAGGLLGAAFGGPLAIVPAAAAGAYIFNRFGALEAVESVETMTRLGVAAYAYDRAKKHNPDLTDTEAMLEAAFVSRDVFDWNRRGSRMIAIVRTITFLNAQIQGLDAAYRKLGGENDRGMVIAKHMNMVWRNENGGALSADERRALGDAYKTMGRMALYTGMLLALYAVATSGGDDDDRDKAYQDIKDKTKSTHSWLPQVFGTDLRLPKAFEWALPANTIEAIADKIRGRDPRAWDRIVDSVYEIAVPPTVPQGLNLIMGLTANVQIDQMAPWVKRLLGREVENNQPRQIVGDALKRLDPEAQFDAWSSQLSIDIAKSMSAIGIPRDMVPSPKKIDFILRTGGYWGQDIQKGYQVVKEALGGRQREEPRINDYPVIGGFTGVAARQSRSRDEMYQLMSQSGGQLKTAAETYKNLLIEQGVPADAERYLARLDPEERIYAILAFHGSPNDKRVHPLERLVMVDNVVNKIRKDVILDRLAPLEKQGRRNVRNFEEKIELNPRRQRQVHEIMERLQQAEAWNSMILMDRPGWQGKKEIKVDPILAELRAASPEVADIYADRLAKTKALSWDDVKSGWPDLRERIAREGVGAF